MRIASFAAAVPFAIAGGDDEASPIFGVKIPTGYRQWEMIGVSRESGQA
jgi:hypothetical protein